MIILKTPTQTNKIKQSCQIVKSFLNSLKDVAVPGTTTLELNELARGVAARNNALPGFEGYRGYPFAICASINEQVVHGFPSNRPLKDGDILSVDFGILKNGYYGDAAITLPIGTPSEKSRRLIETTKESLYLGIEQARVGNRVGDISRAIQSHAEGNGYSVVKEFVGHAIGRQLHEKPQVPNYGRINRGVPLKAGMVIAIEPMLVEGPDAAVRRLKDGWTIVTSTGRLAAHYEHTVLITEDVPVVLSHI